MRREVLGRGVKALIPDMEDGAREGVSELPVDRVRPGKAQPREKFDPQALDELARSLREKGLVQPVLVRPVGDEYELIVGERRWRAARLAGYYTIPALIKDVGDREALELALIENTQRQNLNPIEEANAYQRLTEEFELTHDQVAARLGKDRSYVSNVLRLHRLPEVIKEDLVEGRLTMGHAKAILSAGEDDWLMLRDRIVELGLSVRETEELVRRGATEKKAPKSGRAKTAKSIFVSSLEEELQQSLGTKVRLRPGKRGGRLEIYYYSHEELERLLNVLKSDSS
jgi:ParB family chromosome partitioning protein